MRIDLHNFFKYYDEKNPKHVAAVEQLEVDLKDSPLMDDSANWVRIYRTPLAKPSNLVLDVPFYPQTDNYRDPQRTCNSSACAMCLEYFKPGTLKGAKGDDAYIQKVFSLGDTTYHTVQTKVLFGYGIYSRFSYRLSFADLDRELADGRPVVIGILHRGSLYSPTGGHMVVVIGKTVNGDYIVNDPYGSLNDNYTDSVYNGKGAIYKRSELERRWTVDGPNSGWGRIFDVKKVVSPTVMPNCGVELIKEFEGCHLNAYPDPLSGYLPITIGWGSTKDFDGSAFKLTRKITQQYADKLLINDLKNRFLPSLQKIPHWNDMNENQRGALLSFAYNLGAGFYGKPNFNTITRVLKHKQWDKVPDALYLYRNPGTKVEAGLARRRKAEGKLWNS